MTDEYLNVSSKFIPSEGRFDRRARRDREDGLLKAAGYKTTYRFTLEQRAIAEALVREIKEATGVELGCNKATGF